MLRICPASWCTAGALLLPGLCLQGCAVPGTPVTQTVRVETPDCAQARCELSNDQGQWSLLRTPGSVALTTSREPLKVVCRADDGAQGTRTTGSSMGPTTGAGAVAGGVAGGAAVGVAVGGAALAFIPPLGALVVLAGVGAGAATGQAVESNRRAIHYPELISVTMTCPVPAADAQLLGPALGPALGLGIRGLLPSAALEAGVGRRGGVLVTTVQAGGAAAAAGLRPGDIVLAADGHELGDAADLEERVLALPAGTPLSLRVWRDRQLLSLQLLRTARSP